MYAQDRRLQNIFVAFSAQLKRQKHPLKDIKAIEAISRCRTEALGTAYYSCENKQQTGSDSILINTRATKSNDK